jgi:alkylhydroperoxidase family enzyme
MGEPETDRSTEPVPTARVLDRVLVGPHVEVRARLEAAHDAAWGAVDPVLLELCRLRIAMILGNVAELAHRTPAAAGAGFDERLAEHLAAWPNHPAFGPRERAALALCEQYLLDVASVEADQVARLAEHLGHEGVVDFVNALLVVEQRQRLRLIWEGVL